MITFRQLCAIVCTFLLSFSLNAQDLDSLLNSNLDPALNDHIEIKRLEFVGGGDLNRISQENEDRTAGNVSLGFYLLREFRDGSTNYLEDLEVDFAMNLASSIDSIIGDASSNRFGNYLLQPINNRFSARVNFTAMLRDNVRARKHIAKNQTKDQRTRLHNLKTQRSNKAKFSFDRRLLTTQIVNLRDSILRAETGYKRAYDSLRRTDLGPSRTFLNKILEGAYLNMYADVSDWIRSESDVQTPINTNTFLFQTGVFQEFMPDRLAREHFTSVKTGFGYSLRFLSGDIKRQNKIIDYLGNNARFYHGIDFFTTIQRDNFKADVRIPIIFKRGTEISGLTGSNLLLSIRFIGGFDIRSSRPSDANAIKN